MMKIKIITCVLFMGGLFVLAPGFALGAFNNISFPSGTSVVMTGTSSINLSISAGAKMNNMVVNPTTIVFILEKDGGGTSSVTITSSNGYTLTTNNSTVATCSGNTTTLTLSGPSSTGTTNVTVTPSTTSACPVVVASTPASTTTGTGGASLMAFAPAKKSVAALVNPTPTTPAPPQTPPSPIKTPPACAGVTFTRNLTKGMTGKDVKCLQVLLNEDPMTQIASSGVGSPGNETTLFGAATLKSVIKFQEEYASEVLTPVGLTKGNGIIRALGRAKLNSLLAKAP